MLRNIWGRQIIVSSTGRVTGEAEPDGRVGKKQNKVTVENGFRRWNPKEKEKPCREPTRASGV